VTVNKRILLRDHEGDTLSLQSVGSNLAMHSRISGSTTVRKQCV